jgi:hypothetical protein
MKPKFTGKFLMPLLLAVAGLFLLAPKPAAAQAQDNIANVSSQEQGNIPPAQSDSPNAQADSPNMSAPSANAPDSAGAGMQPAPDDTNDPPTRVARVSYLDGSVSFQPGGTGDWGTAAINRPVTIGDKIWADKDSRVELQAGQASIHLGSMTALSFLNLNQNIIQMRLAEGHVNFRVRELREGETYEIDTPNMAFTVREAGDFRVDVSENGDYTNITVVRGKGEVSVNGQTYPINAGERGDVSGLDANVRYIPGTASAPDALDKWAQDRDLREDNSPSARYVSRDTVGYSDLDDYGTWKNEPDYGNVWVPNQVAAGWAPYSNGYWSYVGPWGWSWVDYAPWGFAPFHYGRWNYFGSYWGWCPGPIYAAPVYGPAFVGFLGFGFGFGFGFGWGGWGHAWFPLGWGEPFHPWYHAGPGYWRNVNYHNTYFHNGFNAGNFNSYRNFNYAYAHNVHAVSGISHEGFVNGHGVNRGEAHLTESSFRGSHVAGGINATPNRSSFVGASNMRSGVSTPSAAVQNRSVMARSTPAAGASHLAAHTFNGSGVNGARGNNAPANSGSLNHGNSPSYGINSGRQSELSANRPPSASNQGNRPGNNGSINNNASRPNNGAGRSWNAQGNTTDSGHAPQGFGSENRASTQNARMNSNDRPPWARSGNSGAAGNSENRNSYSNRPPSNGGNSGRSYTPPSYNGNRGNTGNYNSQRNYSSQGNRGYSAPRNYSSAPRGSYSSPHYSAPHSSGAGSSHSSGGGGYHGGGGGGSHGGGGGGSHGGGGGHGGGHR